MRYNIQVQMSRELNDVSYVNPVSECCLLVDFDNGYSPEILFMFLPVGAIIVLVLFYIMVRRLPVKFQANKTFSMRVRLLCNL